MSWEIWAAVTVAGLAMAGSIVAAIIAWRGKRDELDQDEGIQIRKELREDYLRVKAENKEHEETIAALGEQVEQLKRQNRELERIKGELVQQNMELQEERAIMKRQVDNLTRDVLRLTSEVSTLKQGRKEGSTQA